ncbi:U6 snRNA-associated Sm-like protein LSm7 [Cochliomyia hominivorax]
MSESKQKGGGNNDGKEKRRKESILDLSKYLEKQIRVKFAGGREASGILKGYDALLNLVLDNTIEYLRDPDEPFKPSEETRNLGLVVCRGTALVLICPQDGVEAIPNPFITQ